MGHAASKHLKSKRFKHRSAELRKPVTAPPEEDNIPVHDFSARPRFDPVPAPKATTVASRPPPPRPAVAPSTSVSAPANLTRSVQHDKVASPRGGFCTSCGASIGIAKFCTSCGSPTSPTTQHSQPVSPRQIPNKPLPQPSVPVPPRPNTQTPPTWARRETQPPPRTTQQPSPSEPPLSPRAQPQPLSPRGPRPVTTKPLPPIQQQPKPQPSPQPQQLAPKPQQPPPQSPRAQPSPQPPQPRAQPPPNPTPSPPAIKPPPPQQPKPQQAQPPVAVKKTHSRIRVNEKRDSIRGLDLEGVEEVKSPKAGGVANRWQQTMNDKEDAKEKEKAALDRQRIGGGVKFVDKQIRILIAELKKKGGSANYGELFAATDGVMPALSATLQVARKRGVVAYDGMQVLMQGEDDAVVIRLLKDEIEDSSVTMYLAKSPIKEMKKRKQSVYVDPQGTSKCTICNKTVYPLERIAANNLIFHKGCFKCFVCSRKLTLAEYAFLDGKIFCTQDFNRAYQAAGGKYNFTS